MIDIIWWGQPKPEKQTVTATPARYAPSNPHPRWLDNAYFDTLNLRRRHHLHCEHARKSRHER